MSITCPNSNWALNSAGTACVPTGAKVTCGSTTITLEVHVDHLYADLDSAYYADALVEFGTCVGTVAPDATTGMITDTFSIETCGGDWSQSGNIVVDFEVKGNNAAIDTDVGGVTIITTSVLSFDAHCEYSSTASLTTSHSVDSDSVTADEIQDTTGDFTDQFSLDWFSAATRLSSDKTTPTLGDTVYLQTTSSLALSHEFYLSSCTASKGGQTIALVDVDRSAVIISSFRIVVKIRQSSLLLDSSTPVFQLQISTGPSLLLPLTDKIPLSTSHATLVSALRTAVAIILTPTVEVANQQIKFQISVLLSFMSGIRSK